MFDFLKRFFCPSVFSIRLKLGTHGVSVFTKGKATRAFIKECVEVFEREDLSSLSIYGVNCEYGVRLEFSPNTPASCQQKFRNLWELHK